MNPQGVDKAGDDHGSDGDAIPTATVCGNCGHGLERRELQSGPAWCSTTPVPDVNPWWCTGGIGHRPQQRT